MTKLARILIPPKEWRLPVIILLGAICGLGFYAMVESKAISYLSDDPKTCANCHVMTPQYATWQKSSLFADVIHSYPDFQLYLIKFVHFSIL